MEISNSTKRKRILISLFTSLFFLTFFHSVPNNIQIHRTLSSYYSTAPPLNKNLHYVVFGTSVSWGSRLDSPETQAYPYLLSPNHTTNLAMRASDPSYPSMCTQSMVKDDMQDVVIVEYDRAYRQGLDTLVKRLRRRFPEATIVLLKTWSLMNINVVESSSSSSSKKKKPTKFRTWLNNNGHLKNNPDTWEFVASSSNDIEFIFDESIQEARDDYMKDLAKETNAILYNWEMISEKNNMKELIVKSLPLFQDFVHWNKEGHAFVASGLEAILREQHINNCASSNSCIVGDWGDGDVCDNWIESGKRPSESIMRILPKREETRKNFTYTPLKSFDLAGVKYALSFTNKKTKIEFNNPFKTDRVLSLTYMAVDEKTSTHIYPRVKVHGNWENEVILNPLVQYGFPVHVQKTTQVSIVKPGKDIIELEVLDLDMEEPFKLVGFSITNGEVTASKIFELVLEN